MPRPSSRSLPQVDAHRVARGGELLRHVEVQLLGVDAQQHRWSRSAGPRRARRRRARAVCAVLRHLAAQRASASSDCRSALVVELRTRSDRSVPAVAAGRCARHRACRAAGRRRRSRPARACTRRIAADRAAEFGSRRVSAPLLSAIAADSSTISRAAPAARAEHARHQSRGAVRARRQQPVAHLAHRARAAAQARAPVRAARRTRMRVGDRERQADLRISGTSGTSSPTQAHCARRRCPSCAQQSLQAPSLSSTPWCTWRMPSSRQRAAPPASAGPRSPPPRCRRASSALMP